jgi:hypothetical protein
MLEGDIVAAYGLGKATGLFGLPRSRPSLPRSAAAETDVANLEHGQGLIDDIVRARAEECWLLLSCGV